jgi:hypothetical protein
VFAGVHEQNPLIVLTVVSRRPGGAISICGPLYDLEEFVEGRDAKMTASTSELQTWTRTAAFPLIPDALAGAVFRQMQTHPAFSDSAGFEFRPVQGDINATANRGLFNTDQRTPVGRIPVLTGSSFNLWDPDYGKPYGWTGSEAEEYILAKTLNSASQPRSAFHGLAISELPDLPMHNARISIRDVTNSTNQRTAVVCLLPPDVVLIHKAPYLVRRNGDEKDEAYLLGVMSSIPFDWYSRRLVELTMSFELLSTFPVPRPEPHDSRRLRVIELAGRLGAPDDRFKSWASAVGASIGSVKAAEKEELVVELDALSAHLYCLSREQLIHIFATFHRGWDFGPRLEKVLVHFDALDGTE